MMNRHLLALSLLTLFSACAQSAPTLQFEFKDVLYRFEFGSKMPQGGKCGQTDEKDRVVCSFIDDDGKESYYIFATNGKIDGFKAIKNDNSADTIVRWQQNMLSQQGLSMDDFERQENIYYANDFADVRFALLTHFYPDKSSYITEQYSSYFSAYLKERDNRPLVTPSLNENTDRPALNGLILGQSIPQKLLPGFDCEVDQVNKEHYCYLEDSEEGYQNSDFKYQLTGDRVSMLEMALEEPLGAQQLAKLTESYGGLSRFHAIDGEKKSMFKDYFVGVTDSNDVVIIDTGYSPKIRLLAGDTMQSTLYRDLPKKQI